MREPEISASVFKSTGPPFHHGAFKGVLYVAKVT